MRSDLKHSERYLAISSWEELREARRDLDKEIEVLGAEVTTSAKSLLVTGAKATAAGVATVLLTKAVTAYLRLRSHRASQGETPDSEVGPDPVKETLSSGFSRAAGILMWIDTIAKLLINAKRLYDEMVLERAGSTEEE